MVEIKVDKKEILFRVVLSGDEGATKFATVRELHDALREQCADDITVILAGGDKIVGFRWQLKQEEDLFGMSVLIDVLCRPGPLRTTANDVLIYRSADAIIHLDHRDAEKGQGVGGFEDMLHELESLARKPEELPVLVQTYSDAASDREKTYRELETAWRPDVHVRGDGFESSLDILQAAKQRIMSNYRAYEEELQRQGLSGHIKIRDRVYECVPAEGGTGASEAGEERLFSHNQDTLGPVRPGLKLWMVLAAALILLAAVAVSTLL